MVEVSLATGGACGSHCPAAVLVPVPLRTCNCLILDGALCAVMRPCSVMEVITTGWLVPVAFKAVEEGSSQPGTQEF